MNLSTAPNGNTMFLPIRDNYWSRRVYVSFYAHEFGYNLDKWCFYGGARCNGYAMRVSRE